MQISPSDVALQAVLSASSGITARVAAGNLASLPIGSLLKAVVTSVTPREAVLTVNGQQLTIRPSTGLQPGTALFVRVPPNAANAPNPTVELSVPEKPTPTQQQSAGVAARVATPLLDEASQPATSSVASAPQVATDNAKPPVSPSLGLNIDSRPVVVDVRGSLPGGRLQVAIDGQEQVATSSQPLVPGQRYVLQVERTPTGIVLNPPPETPKLTTEVATAVLRTPAPTLGTALQPLQAELTALTAPPSEGNTPTIPAAVRDAAVAVRDTLNSILPQDPRPLNSTELQQLVENGGLHYEAKLARVITEADSPQQQASTPVESKSAAETPANTRDAAKPEAANTPTASDTTKSTASPTSNSSRAPNATSATASSSTHEIAADLKGDLLRLMQAVHDLGGSAHAPAAQAALNGIESQQAANSLAQANGAPYFLQVPFPDGGEWKTLQLSLEPQNQPDQPDAERAGRFRVFMHVPLNDLGETWIDAGVAGSQFRATIYLDQSTIRDRVREALPELRTELQNDGFSEVLLDVRAASDLPERYRRETNSLDAGRPASVSVLDVKV